MPIKELIGHLQKDVHGHCMFLPARHLLAANLGAAWETGLAEASVVLTLRCQQLRAPGTISHMHVLARGRGGKHLDRMHFSANV